MSKEISGYQTRQRSAVLAFFVRHPDTHFTADSLTEALRSEDIVVGKTTVYRTLERLVESGMIRRFTLPTADSACYQYAGNDPAACSTHFHLKCLVCGTLFHVDCEHLRALGDHLQKDHGFCVDYSQTVLYGICADCNTGKQ